MSTCTPTVRRSPSRPPRSSNGSNARASSPMPQADVSPRAWALCLALLAVAFAHHTVPYLTTMPRVNVDEPWVMERAYQVLLSGRPHKPMLGLTHAYLLQPGYGYLLVPWFGPFRL